LAPKRRESVCYMLWVVAAVVVIGGYGQVVVVV
jgi:nitrate reductase NapE component